MQLRNFGIVGLVCVGLALPSAAAYPDRATYEFTLEQYNLFLRNSRDGCGYYANPNTLTQPSNSPNLRELSVLVVRGGPGSGSGCYGVFEFQVLRVNCQTDEVRYARQTPGEQEDKLSWSKDEEVARLACDLSLPSASDRQDTLSPVGAFSTPPVAR
jgi:hypothetical protein